MKKLKLFLIRHTLKMCQRLLADAEKPEPPPQPDHPGECAGVIQYRECGEVKTGRLFMVGD